MSVMPSFIDRDISEVSLYVVLLNGTALGIVLNIESKPLFSGSELSFSISFFLASSKPGASEAAIVVFLSIVWSCGNFDFKVLMAFIVSSMALLVLNSSVLLSASSRKSCHHPSRQELFDGQLLPLSNSAPPCKFLSQEDAVQVYCSPAVFGVLSRLANFRDCATENGCERWGVESSFLLFLVDFN
uniref:Uncharacterized protein n=1 Tax=Rhizophagus irregularis (strain DAOM 181602 / DAOM 197198 / MUCL 43194) TaxID=747089 RepID=U9TQ39_RHIID